MRGRERESGGKGEEYKERGCMSEKVEGLYTLLYPTLIFPSSAHLIIKKVVDALNGDARSPNGASNDGKRRNGFVPHDLE